MVITTSKKMKLQRPNLKATFLRGKASPIKTEWTNSCVLTDDKQFVLYGVRDLDLDHMRDRNAEGMCFEGPKFKMILVVNRTANMPWSERHDIDYKHILTLERIKTIQGDFKPYSVDYLIELFGTLAVCLESYVQSPKRSMTQDDLNALKNVVRIFNTNSFNFLTPEISTEFSSMIGEEREMNNVKIPPWEGEL